MPAPHLTLTGHSDRVSALAWLSDGRLATASFDKTVRLWDPLAGKLLKTLATLADLPLAMAAAPADPWLAVGGKGTGLRLWNLSADQPPQELTAPTKSVFRIAFSPDGKQLASCGEDDSRITLWDLATAKSVKTLNAEDPDDKNQRRSQFALAYSPDGKRLASGGADRLVRLWDWEAAKETRRLTGAEYVLFKEMGKQVERDPKQGSSEFAVYSVAFSPDGKQVASGGLDKTVRVWNAETGELLRSLGVSGFVHDLQFATNEQLFVGNHNGALQLWNVADGQLAWSEKLPTLIAAARLSLDGKFAAAAGADGLTYLAPVNR